MSPQRTRNRGTEYANHPALRKFQLIAVIRTGKLVTFILRTDTVLPYCSTYPRQSLQTMAFVASTGNNAADCNARTTELERVGAIKSGTPMVVVISRAPRRGIGLRDLRKQYISLSRGIYPDKDGDTEREAPTKCIEMISKTSEVVRGYCRDGANKIDLKQDVPDTLLTLTLIKHKLVEKPAHN